MRVVLILGVLVVVAYLAVRQFGSLSSHSTNPVQQNSAALAKSNPGGTCGIVADVRSAAADQGPALFVDLGRPHPIETMQVVIPQSDLGRFDPSPAAWEGKRICVSGAVRSYGGRPEIVARGPEQVRISPK